MKKALIILIPGFPTDENDTTCLPSPQSFIRCFNKEFPNIKIIILAFHYPYRVDQYVWYGNSVYSFNGKNYPAWLRPLLWLKVIRQLNKLIRIESVLGILSFWCLEEALVGKYFCQWKKIPHKIWMHGQDARKRNSFLSWIKPSAEDLVAISESLAQEVKKNHNIYPAHVIHNGIEPSNERIFPNKTIHLLGAGSLIPLKQFDVLLRAAKELQRSIPELQVVLVGSGPERSILEREINRLGLNHSITLTGEVPHEMVLDFMRRSKVFLHPSSYEGYSTVCLEALYSGCHVVSFVYPEKIKINHWHRAENEVHMINICRELLSPGTEFKSILVHNMRDSAIKMVDIFIARK